MKRFLYQLELGWHILALTILSGAFVPLWRLNTIGSISTSTGDTVQQVVLLLAYSGLILLARHWRQSSRWLAKGWLIWVTIGITVLSIFWSQDPALTLRRSVTLILATLYGLLLAVRYPFTTILRLLGAALAIIVGVSLLSILLGAEWAIMGHPHPGAWQGVMFHKNALGRISVLALITFVVLAQKTQWPWHVGWWLLAVSALVIIIGTRSATALVATTVLITIWLVAQKAALLSRREQLQGIILFGSVALPVGILFFLYWTEITELLGRDAELTGRLPLWLELFTIGWQQPLLGYGYGAFWLDTNRMMSLDAAILRMRFWWAEHAHNGYLDVWLEIGIIGLTLVSFLVVSVLYRSFQKVLQHDFRQQFMFSCLFAIFLVVYNLSEAVLIEANLAKAIFWILFSWIYFSDRLTHEQMRESLE